MAAVTVAARFPKRDDAGARKAKIFKITGVDTNTLDTGIRDLDAVVLVEPCTITSIARAASNGQLRLTISASGAFTAVLMRVSART